MRRLPVSGMMSAFYPGYPVTAGNLVSLGSDNKDPLKMGLNITDKIFMLSDLLYKAAGQAVNMTAGLSGSYERIVPGVVYLSENAPEHKAGPAEIVIGKPFNGSGEKAFLSDKLFGLFGVKRGEDVLF
jgi:hypothetical protein